jgi:hypothetical protein
MQHCATWVKFQRLIETGKSFFLIKAKTPVQSLVKQALGNARFGADCIDMTSQIKAEYVVIFHFVIHRLGMPSPGRVSVNHTNWYFTAVVSGKVHDTPEVKTKKESDNIN